MTSSAHNVSTYRQMLGLWNIPHEQRPERIDEVIDPDLVIHQNGEQRHGSDALAEMIEQGSAPFDDIDVRLDAGPVADDELVAARWSFAGTYTGGVPGASARAGTRVDFTGLDLVRLREGRIVEYWVCSDTAALEAQMGIGDRA